MNIREFLREVDLFRDLAPADLERLASLARVETFSRGAVIVREREPAGRIYAVLSGIVETVQAGRRMARLERGEVFGEMALLEKGPSPAAAQAAVVPETHVAAWDLQPLLALMAQDASLAAGLLRGLARRLARRLRAASEAVAALHRAMDSA
ncbi:MAG: cyclic nucleotide-binding domain-containing protein [Planctomycetes bacterium]|nr:cyclic nucleotide-binding domain-containing protein [Planctomycetota bacterium]